MMEWRDVAGVAALLKEFISYVERYLEPAGDLLAGDIAMIVNLEDALPGIDPLRSLPQRIIVLLLFKGHFIV